MQCFFTGVFPGQSGACQVTSLLESRDSSKYFRQGVAWLLCSPPVVLVGRLGHADVVRLVRDGLTEGHHGVRHTDLGTSHEVILQKKYHILSDLEFHKSLDSNETTSLGVS